MSVLQFFIIMLGAVTLENLVFARALGLTGYVLGMDSPWQVIQYGLSYTWVSLLSSLGFLAYRELTVLYEISPMLEAVAFLALVILAYVVTYGLAKFLFPVGFASIRQMLPLTAFNTALFGVLYLLQRSDFTLGGTIAYVLGAGIGYTLAALLVLSGKKQLAHRPVPRSFRGMPVLLIYIGIVSLALYGLLGYGLTA